MQQLEEAALESMLQQYREQVEKDSIGTFPIPMS